MDFFGIGFLELVVIVVVALLAFGPDKIPEVAKKAGAVLVQARRSVNEARSALLEDTDLADLRKLTYTALEPPPAPPKPPEPPSKQAPPA
ncbi:MAG: twin-arginine translocase TatA/TatE family subunit [Chloroflexi bacterium]|nr:twin-arginine translocase TatA/TatE family subunit [Chloroflexota bacterium]